MPPRRRVPVAEGAAALEAWADTGGEVERSVLATAVRYALEELAARHPGRSVEVRVPPFGAAQALQGPTHRRGTPPNVVETDAGTWLGLATGRLSWVEASASGLVRDSGVRADLSAQLPLF